MESKNLKKSSTPTPTPPISDQELSMQKAFERALVNVWLPSQIKYSYRNATIDATLARITKQTGDKIENLWDDTPPPPPTPPQPRYLQDGKPLVAPPSLKAKRSLDLAGALQVFSILLQLATVALLALALGRL